MSRELRKALDLDGEDKGLPVALDPTNDDIEFARKTMYDIIGKIQDVSEDLIDLARQSQQPRAYEVLNAVLKNAADVSRDLVELQKLKKDITGISPDAPPQTVNNNLFVGTTSDLHELINKMKSGNNEDEIL